MVSNDAGPPPFDASAYPVDYDAAIAPCSISNINVFYVDVSGMVGSVSNGPHVLLGQPASWVAGYAPGELIEVQTDEGAQWQFALSNGSLMPPIGLGTFLLSGTVVGTTVDMFVNYQECVDPIGRVVVGALTTSSDQYGFTLDSVQLAFNVSCPGGGGVTGCVSYTAPR